SVLPENSLYNLTDSLIDDLLDVSSHDLLNEVADDHGDARALAASFNSATAQSERQLHKRKFLTGFYLFLSALWPRGPSDFAVILGLASLVILISVGIVTNVFKSEPSRLNELAKICATETAQFRTLQRSGRPEKVVEFEQGMSCDSLRPSVAAVLDKFKIQ